MGLIIKGTTIFPMTSGAPIDAQVDLTWVKWMWIKVGKKFGGILRQDSGLAIRSHPHKKPYKVMEVIRDSQKKNQRISSSKVYKKWASSWPHLDSGSHWASQRDLTSIAIHQRQEKVSTHAGVVLPCRTAAFGCVGWCRWQGGWKEPWVDRRWSTVEGEPEMYIH